MSDIFSSLFGGLSGWAIGESQQAQQQAQQQGYIGLGQFVGTTGWIGTYQEVKSYGKPPENAALPLQDEEFLPVRKRRFDFSKDISGKEQEKK